MTVSRETKNIALLSLITLLVWVLFELYMISSEGTIPKDYTENTTPINPEIDVELLESLQNRLSF